MPHAATSRLWWRVCDPGVRQGATDGGGVRATLAHSATPDRLIARACNESEGTTRAPTTYLLINC